MKRLTFSLSITPGRLLLGALLVGGIALAAAPTIQPMPWLFKSRVDVAGGLYANVLDAGVIAINGVSVAAAAAQDGGTSTPLCQFGYGAMTSGALTVTFTKAFSSVPQCNCTHINTTNSNACVLDATAVPSTTAAKFLVASGGTDVAEWICCGDK